MLNFLRGNVLAAGLIATSKGMAVAQTPSPPPATKIGVVNIGYVLTKYNKAIIMKKELELDLEPYKAEAKKISDIMKQHQERLEKSGKLQQAEAESSAKAVRAGQRALEDLDRQVRTLIGKKQESQIVALHKDIHSAVQMHSQHNGFHMIFAFSELSDLDKFSSQSVDQKWKLLDWGAAIPYYVQPGLDISDEILERIHRTPMATKPPDN